MIRPRRSSLATLLAGAVLLVPLGACSDDGPDEGEARLELDEGEARIVRQDGDVEEVADDTDVHTGDEVTLLEGTGRLELRGDTVLELRAGTVDGTDSVVVMGPRPVVEAGDVLVDTDGRFAVTADETVLTITGGAARVARAAGVEVASYTAAVHLDSAGQEREVPALREMQVPALGLPPDRPRPFEYDAEDPWDRRFLGEAIELGDRLDALASGYTQNLDPGDGRTVAFFRDVLTGLADEPELTADLLTPGREAGETLIGAAIADLGRRGTFAERWRAVFAFRDDGASWGLVALDQGVDRGPLLDAVTDAVDETPLAIAPPPAEGPRGPGGGGDGIDGGTDGGGGDGGDPGPAPTTPTTRPPRPPAPTTSVPPPFEEESEGLLPPLLGPIIDPVTDLLSGLVDGLLGGLFTAGR